MSRWKEAFEVHPFKTTWNSIKTLLQAPDFETGNVEAAVFEIARLNKVIAYIDSVIEQVDPELMPLSTFDTMNQQASQCLQQLTPFKANQNIGHLHNANANMDQVLAVVSQTPFILSAQQKGALSKAAKAYSETLNQYLEKLSSSIDEEIGSLKTEVNDVDSNLAKVKASLGSVEEEIKVVSQTIEKQTAEFNTQFQASEKDRSEKFNKLNNRLQTKVDELTSSLQVKTDKTFENVAQKSGVTLDVLGKYLDDAKKVFGVVVNTLQAGAYSSYANEEKRTANFLRWSAIALMVTGVGILVIPEVFKIITAMESYTLDWRITLGRIPFSLILFVPAFYLARESSKHRGTEVVNRRRELILATIDPYLVLLDDERAKNIKEDIAKGIFSEEGLPSTNDGVSESSNVVAQIANLVKQLKK